MATLASAIATAILMYAAYHWPAGHNEHEDNEQTRSQKRHAENARRHKERQRNDDEDAQRELEDDDER